MVKTLLKCNICENEFEINAKMHYICRDNNARGISALAGNEETLYDAFDCPFCGCQHVVQERKRFWLPKDTEKKEEEKPDCFGDYDLTCDDCKYYNECRPIYLKINPLKKITMRNEK